MLDFCETWARFPEIGISFSICRAGRQEPHHRLAHFEQILLRLQRSELFIFVKNLCLVVRNRIGHTSSFHFVHQATWIVIPLQLMPWFCLLVVLLGPSMLVYDARMIPNLKLRDLVVATAAELDIPLQFSAMTGGATDGGMIHLHNEGVPTVVIGVPTRHIHSHNALLHRDDYDRALKLVVALVQKLDAETVAGFTN